MAIEELQRKLRACLQQMTVRAWRLHLETPGVLATVPMLRGVWGAALHDIDLGLYRSLFEGGTTATPGYLLRPAPPQAEPAPALEMVLFGSPCLEIEEVVWRAWELALQRGLGPGRAPGHLVEVRPLAWDGSALAPSRLQPGFALAPLPWPAGAIEPCRLHFAVPLRLLRHKRLIEYPTLADLTVAAWRRLYSLAPQAIDPVWNQRQEWVQAAWTISADLWVGQPLDLVRYSARQHSELELRGVTGDLVLPSGPGVLAELLTAMTWLHLGKGTVMGMGQLNIVPDGSAQL